MASDSSNIKSSLTRRDFLEKSGVTSAAFVRDGRYYLQLAGAEARERLLMAAAKTWSVPASEEYSFSLMYAPEKKVTGPNPFAPTQQIELKMHQFEIEFGYSW